MKSLRFAAALPLIAVLACGPASGPGPQPSGPAGGLAPTQGMLDNAARSFDEIRNGFVEWYFEAHPVRASELGVHQHDARLPNLTRSGIRDRIDDLLEWLADLEGVRFDLMRGADRYDYAVLEYGIRSELLVLEESREWANDPGLYTALIARGLYAVATWEYASLAERIQSLESRLAGGRELLATVRTNVRNPPRLWTELAIADARALVAYLEEDLPATLTAQSSGAPPDSGLETARTLLVEDLDSHVTWLESELLPRSSGSFRLGRYLFQRKLMYGEHVMLSVEELERLNGEATAEALQRLEETARAIDPDRTPRAIMDSLDAAHPEPAELLATAREMMTEARDWVVSSLVVEVPRSELPTVRAAPPFARGVFSSLDTPGPFESPGLGAYYNLTTPGAGWDDEQIRQHMAYFSYPALMATTLYETFPGRYLQWQYRRDLPVVRRLFVPGTLSGGWADYAAEMALDQGLSEDAATRMGQLRRVLLHHARWDAALRLHTASEPVDDVVARFMEIAGVSEFPARREVVRATREPLVLTDALGRLQIRELRDDYEAYQADREATFSLPEFHHRLLRLGLPYALAREALIPTGRDSDR